MSEEKLPTVAGHGHPVRKYGPYVVGAALLAWVWYGTDFDAFRRALASVNYVAYLATMMGFTLALLSFDALAMQRIYRDNVCALRVRDLFVLRGASYLPSILNYHLGQAWLAWFVTKSRRASATRVAGATLLVYATMFASLCILAAAAYFAQTEPAAWLAPTLVVVGISGLGYLAVVAARPRFLARLDVAALLLDAGVRGHFVALLWRFPHILVLFLAYWLPYGFFDVNVDLPNALTLVPPLLLIGVLPLTPQGVGTRDAVAVQLLARFGPGQADQEGAAAVAAATFAWAVSLTLCQCLISLFLMKAAHELLERVAPARTTTET